MSAQTCLGCHGQIRYAFSWATGRLLVLADRQVATGGHQIHLNGSATLTGGSGYGAHDCGHRGVHVVIFSVVHEIRVVPAAAAWDRTHRFLGGRLRWPAHHLDGLRAALEGEGLHVHVIPPEA